MVIYQTYNVHRLGQWGGRREYLLELRELTTHFPGWKVLHDDEVGEISRFVALRPLAESPPAESEAKTE
jgi:hypothetical protein